MINRELLKAAQEQRNEEQRKQAEDAQKKLDEYAQARFKQLQSIFARLGVEVSTEDMILSQNAPATTILVQVGDTLTGYPFIVVCDGTWEIRLAENSLVLPMFYFTFAEDAPRLVEDRARFADMLDAYDKTRAEALEQFAAEFPKPAEPAQDETLDDLAAEVDILLFDLREYSSSHSQELKELVSDFGKAWKAFAQRALAAPAEPTTPCHPDFEEWYSRLEYGLTVRIGSIIVGLNSDHMAIMDQLKVTFEDVKDAKKELADLQNAIMLVEQWNKDKEDSANDIGWNDHHEGK